MPEPSAEPGEEIIRSLATDERREMVPPDAASLQIAAVEAGPEIAGAAAGRKRLGIGAWLAAIWLILVIGSAIAAPILPIPDPKRDSTLPELSSDGSLSVIAAAPSLDHPFGLDASGLDVFSRTIWGGRASLIIGFVSIGLGFLVGGFLGMLSGYFKGKVGGFIGSLLDILLAFPQLVLAIFVVEVLGHTVWFVTFALAIVATPVLARITRASSLSWSEREFVVAARAQGAKHGRVMLREVLPNTLPAMFAIAILSVAVVIVAEAGLAIVGAGVNPSVITWGNMISAGQADLKASPHIVLAPSLVIFLTVLSLNYLGDVIRARTDVRESAL
ncbi:MAG TPA: ABC transporter permease [Acidimicrobiia bacterium]|nr:ABC transporter permease [Acidimicrobiia bacterium]